MINYAFFTCDWNTTIKNIIHSTLDSKLIYVGKPLYTVFHKNSQKKVLNFCKDIKKNNFSYGWDLNIEQNNEIVNMILSGAIIDNKILIALTEKDTSISKYYEEMLRVNNQQINQIRVLQQKLASFEDNLATQFDEISKLNNELINTKRLLEQKNASLEQLNNRLERISTTDELTKLYNRRYFFDNIKSEISRAKRMNYTVTLLSIDINNFKRVNDTLGHLAGDKLLKKLACIIQEKIRDGLDIPFRFGGDEFLILLSDCNKDQALIIAKRIDSQFKSHTEIASLAYGVKELDLDNPNIENLLLEADKNMYKHKEKIKKRE